MSEPDWKIGSVVFGPGGKPVPLVTSQGGKPHNFEFIKGLETRIEELTRRNALLEADSRKAAAQMEEDDAEIERLEGELARLAQERDDALGLTDALKDCQEELKRHVEQVAALERECDLFQQENHRLLVKLTEGK